MPPNFNQPLATHAKSKGLSAETKLEHVSSGQSTGAPLQPNLSVVIDPSEIIIISDDDEEDSAIEGLIPDLAENDGESSDDSLVQKPSKTPAAAAAAAVAVASTRSPALVNAKKRVRSANADDMAAAAQTKRRRSIPTSSEDQDIQKSLSHTGDDRLAHPQGSFRRRLVDSPALDLVNDVDGEDLPKNFKFINEYILREGTARLHPDARTGCSCKFENGRSCGCEYVEKCDCLGDTERDSQGRRIGFPYHAKGAKAGLLQPKYLNARYMIYECNDLCNCGPLCRNRVIQHGRTIPLEIFRTRDRGWGLRSTVAVRKGQFLDTYRGEVITSEEADRRENDGQNRTKDSYLFTLDKFHDQSELYVVDGEFMGGPTRFLNHSCDPNCGNFGVSNVRGDCNVYDIAIFALEDIPAGTEFTFDYVEGKGELVANDDEAEKAELDDRSNGKLATRCLCGSENCRGYLWL